MKDISTASIHARFRNNIQILLSIGAAVPRSDDSSHCMRSAAAGSSARASHFLALSVAAASGQLLYAIEAGYNNGPWNFPEHFNKTNGVLRYSAGDGQTGYSITAMGYRAHWNSTDQIPLRAVQSGIIDRYGAIDPTDGGQTARYSVSFNGHRPLTGGNFDSTLYAVQSTLTLVRNFTFFLADPINGDQFRQTENRRLYGFNAREVWHSQ